jgi:nuclear cap-binding protein subunit 1
MEDDEDEVPTDEIIERMDERLEAAQNQQKRLFLIIFQVCGIQHTQL